MRLEESAKGQQQRQKAANGANKGPQQHRRLLSKAVNGPFTEITVYNSTDGRQSTPKAPQQRQRGYIHRNPEPGKYKNWPRPSSCAASAKTSSPSSPTSLPTSPTTAHHLNNKINTIADKSEEEVQLLPEETTE